MKENTSKAEKQGQVDEKQQPNKPDKNPGEQQQHNLVELNFVVSGEETVVKTNQNNKLIQAIQEALRQTNNSNARPISDWKVRYNNSPVTKTDGKISEYGFQPDTFIYLSLDSGTGGAGLIIKGF